MATKSFKQRVAEMTDAELSSVLVNREDWQDDLYRCAVAEAGRRQIGIGKGPGDIIRQQALDIQTIVRNGILNAENLADIKRKLVSSGVPDAVAVGAINEAAPAIAKLALEKSQRSYRLNLSIFFIGIAVTFVTYMMASPGGSFFLAWGAIVFGGVQARLAYRKIQHWERVIAETNSSSLAAAT